MRREEFRKILVADFGEPFTISYFDRSGFAEGQTPVLYPWSYVAETKFRQEGRRTLQREGVKLGPPILEHLKNPRQRAA